MCIRDRGGEDGKADAPEAAAEAGAPDKVSPVTTLQASPPPAAAAPASAPLDRPLAWSSTDGGKPRSASGEILVQKLAPMRQSQIDIPRVAVREDSAKSYAEDE